LGELVGLLLMHANLDSRLGAFLLDVVDTRYMSGFICIDFCDCLRNQHVVYEFLAFLYKTDRSASVDSCGLDHRYHPHHLPDLSCPTNTAPRPRRVGHSLFSSFLVLFFSHYVSLHKRHSERLRVFALTFLPKDSRQPYRPFRRPKPPLWLDREWKPTIENPQPLSKSDQLKTRAKARLPAVYHLSMRGLK